MDQPTGRSSIGRENSPWRGSLRRAVRTAGARSWFLQLPIGAAAGLLAVGVRMMLPLAPQQLPTITIVVTLALITAFVGVVAGIATALVGGITVWYLLFNPNAWSLANGQWLPLLGFSIIATVIVSTTHLYRSSERLHHERELAELEEQAATAQLFAREMAHRLKNALAIVQAIAFQTLGANSGETARFAGRLKALANANELLSEHVTRPVADVTEVIEAALEPFDDQRAQIQVNSVAAAIPAQQVVSLALALHELATNAVKYGALSTASGRVTVGVEDRGDYLNLAWTETRGPPVERPAGAGFGTRLLRRSGVNTQLDFASDGLKCTFGIRKS